MTFDDFSKNLTKAISTVPFIGVGLLINPYKAVVLKTDTPDGGVKGFAKSGYGIDNAFTTAMTFSCKPVKGGGQFVVKEYGPFSPSFGNKTVFYPTSCQAGFNTLFGQPSSLTGMYKMPDHDHIRKQWQDSPPDRIIASTECKVNGIKIFGEDYVDGTGSLEAYWTVKAGTSTDVTGAHINGFPSSMLPAGSHAAQAQALCNKGVTKKDIQAPRNVMTRFYGDNTPYSVYLANGDEGTLSLRGFTQFSAQKLGGRNPRTVNSAIQKLQKASHGEVKAGEMRKLFTTMTGITPGMK